MRSAFLVYLFGVACSSEDATVEPVKDAATEEASIEVPGICKCPLSTADEPKLTDPVVTAAGTAESGSFSPRCFAISPGTSVTFEGNFATHPTAPNPSSDPFNPIPSVDTGTSFSVTFTDPGRFGFHCTVHGTENFGMCGAVFVGP